MTVWLLSMLIAPATAVRAIHSDRPTLRDIHGNYTWPNSAEEWKAEMPEQHLIHKYLKTGAVVLEVGGNIGRATIVAAESVGPNGRIYSSEANEEEKRKQRERCKPLIDADRVHLIPPISDIPLYQQGWFTNTEKATPARLAYTGMKAEDWREIPTLTYKKLTKTIPPWDTIIADCEGCFHTLCKAHPEILNGVKTVIVEHDAHTTAGLDPPQSLRETLAAAGFSRCPRGCASDEKCEQGCFFEAWERP